MSGTEPRDRKEVLSSIFRRKGGDGAYTRLFDSLDREQRDLLLTTIELHDRELPIIGSVPNVDYCFLLTTERLVWYFGGARHSLQIEELRDAVADFNKHNYGTETKSRLNELVIVTMENDRHLVALEPGKPLFGVWNTLKNLGRTNRNRARIAG
jgi:hypothetical protein